MNLIGIDAVKARALKGFGERLAGIRQSRGMTQAELARASGISRRMIAYYEQDDAAQAPGSVVADLARALRVTADELLGLKATPMPANLRHTRLLNRLKVIEELPEADRRAVLKFIEALIAKHRSAAQHDRRPTSAGSGLRRAAA